MYQCKRTVKTDLRRSNVLAKSRQWCQHKRHHLQPKTNERWSRTKIQQRWNVIATNDHVPNSSGRQAGLSTWRNSPSTMRRRTKSTKQMSNRSTRWQRTNGDNRRQRSSRNNPEIIQDLSEKNIAHERTCPFKTRARRRENNDWMTREHCSRMLWPYIAL